MNATTQMQQVKDPIAARFAELVTAIDRHADDLKLQCADATMDGDFHQTEELLEASKKVLAFRSEVVALSARWSDGRLRLPNPLAPKGAKQLAGHHRKGPQTRLRVALDSRVIERPTAAETFATALELMGLERVAPLGKRLSGIALVSKIPGDGYQSQIRKGDWYITTHSDTADKKKLLQDIGAELNIPVRVEVVG